jgi:outer membrane protein OmpA-like peptidoglycan-associated protein
LALGAALSLATATSASAQSAPSQAEPAYSVEAAVPAYSVDMVVAVFVKDKAVFEAYRRTTRYICLGDSVDCPRKHPPAPTCFDLVVSFQDDSDKLTVGAQDNLNQFAKALLDPRLKGEKFEIAGHANVARDEEHDLRLSERRAISVVSYLASRGVDKSLLSAKGVGAMKPRVADPRSPENSRVEARLAQ